MARILRRNKNTPRQRINVELFLDDVETIEVQNHPIEISSYGDVNRTFMQGHSTYSVRFTQEACVRLYEAMMAAADQAGAHKVETVTSTSRAISFQVVGGDDEQGDSDR